MSAQRPSYTLIAEGEIDVFESTHSAQLGFSAFHTNPGCTMDTSVPFSGTLADVTDCDSYATGNLGCTIRSPAPAGDAFNQIGGGVFAMAWTADGISIWFFRRDAIPQDIKDGTPKHSTWGVPITTLSSSRCNSAAFFKNHSMVINTTLCGDWAGGTWSQPNPGFGQYQSAAQMTGYASCEDFVRNEGAQFANAYFEINVSVSFQSVLTDRSCICRASKCSPSRPRNALKHTLFTSNSIRQLNVSFALN